MIEQVTGVMLINVIVQTTSTMHVISSGKLKRYIAWTDKMLSPLQSMIAVAKHMHTFKDLPE